MFLKPYKLKSNNTLKNSEKKQLAQRILDSFPNANDEKVKELVPVKAASSCMRVTLYSGEVVGVYVIGGFPIMIELEEVLIPTLCALWKVPDLMPVLTIHSPVMSKVAAGVPLYIPGVVLGTAGSQVPQFTAGTIVAACTTDNAAVGLIGRAIVSSADLLFKGSGVCLETIHVYRDLLCKEIKFAKIERPVVAPPSDTLADELPTQMQQLTLKHQQKEEWPSLSRSNHVPPPSAPNEPQVILEPACHDTIIQEEHTHGVDTPAAMDESSIPADMDGLLRWSLLSFLKLHAKNIELPLKTNLLYKNHMIPLVPPDRSLDVKKSSYKKMGKFLEAMQQEGLIVVHEVEKGVSALVGVEVGHAAVRAHRVAAPALVAAPPASDSEPLLEYAPPLVRDLHCVTAAVAALFPEHKKGTAVSSGEVREAVQAHVRARQLPTSRGRVALDDALAALAGCPPQECVPWAELMSAVLSRMTAATEMTFPDGTVKLIKSRLEPIKMQVATRSGNKKVTLVSNLESYGFSPTQLVSSWQRGAGAAVTVTRAPSRQDNLLQLQGDQTLFVAKTLIEKYGLPKKFVEGADKALRRKK